MGPFSSLFPVHPSRSPLPWRAPLLRLLHQRPGAHALKRLKSWSASLTATCWNIRCRGFWEKREMKIWTWTTAETWHKCGQTTATTRKQAAGLHRMVETRLNQMSGNTAVMEAQGPDPAPAQDQDLDHGRAARAETTSSEAPLRMATKMALTYWELTSGLPTQWTHMEALVGTYSQRSWISVISTENPTENRQSTCLTSTERE